MAPVNIRIHDMGDLKAPIKSALKDSTFLKFLGMRGGCFEPADIRRNKARVFQAGLSYSDIPKTSKFEFNYGFSTSFFCKFPG